MQGKPNPYNDMKLGAFGLGTVGLLLYITGIVDGWWWPIMVFGMCVLGAALAPKPPRLAKGVARARSEDDLKRNLDRLVTVARKQKLPDAIVAKVASIRDSIVSILPNIMALKVMDKDLFHIKKTALSYLPEALDNYIAIPRQVALTHEIRDGKTSTDMLMNQLDILDAEMKEIVLDFDKEDLVRLEVHGRFLEQKFNKADLLS